MRPTLQRRVSRTRFWLQTLIVVAALTAHGQAVAQRGGPPNAVQKVPVILQQLAPQFGFNANPPGQRAQANARPVAPPVGRIGARAATHAPARAVQARPAPQQTIAPTTASAGHGWPNAMEYGRAMQNPQAALLDPALRGGTIERDARGFPVAYAGSFSSVYRVTVQGKTYAVRCFHPPAGATDRAGHRDWQRRYQLLTQYLQQNPTRESLDFEWVPQGIRVNGLAYPTLRMTWVAGRTLDRLIARRLEQRRPEVVKILADNFRATVHDLRQRRLAHGDLHHGNIMVQDDGRMRLVDYDAMYAPPLAGMENLELGHPNFQHPKRDTSLYGTELDNFSSIVIYLSLVAVSADPALWREFHNEDNLIFRLEDFQNPHGSRVFAALGRSSSPEVRALARSLQRFTAMAPSNVPPLEQALATAQQANVAWYKPNGPPAAAPPPAAPAATTNTAPTAPPPAPAVPQPLRGPDGRAGWL